MACVDSSSTSVGTATNEHRTLDSLLPQPPKVANPKLIERREKMSEVEQLMKQWFYLKDQRQARKRLTKNSVIA